MLYAIFLKLGTFYHKINKLFGKKLLKINIEIIFFI